MSDEKFDMRNFFGNTNNEQSAVNGNKNIKTVGSARTSRVFFTKGRPRAWLLIIASLIIMASILFFFLREQNILFIKHNTKFYIDPKELEGYKHVQPF